VVPVEFAVALVTTGIGFSIVSVRNAESVGEATLTAVIVTEFVLGSSAGAVYKPLLEMIPVPGVPPVTPFTDQVTLVLAALATTDMS